MKKLLMLVLITQICTLLIGCCPCGKKMDEQPKPEQTEQLPN